MRITEIPRLSERPADGHKGTFGRVLIIGGSVGMSGSVALSGMAALRSGSGLVYLAVPDVILPTVASFEPSYLTVPLPADEQGRVSLDALATIQSKLSGMDVCAIGPGLGNTDQTQQLVKELYRTQQLPMVIDADGLNALSTEPSVLSDHAGPRVLTPHPGEFGRLLNCGIDEVQNDRENLATKFAADHGIVLVLKGASTVVTNGVDVFINTTGNSGMATGGTGDVLTGIISALLGTGMESFPAAQLAVHIHGRAGDIAAEKLSEQGMIAADLIRFLPDAWSSFLTR